LAAGVCLHHKETIMTKQQISLTEPNDERLKSQSDKQIDWIRLKLEKAEESGFTTDTKGQILKQSEDLLDE
jgi:antitoxin ParD1/3/4